MEMIGRISKGSRMDQIYLPKNRHGFGIGDYIVIRPLETEINIERPYFYSTKHIEPIKFTIIKEIFDFLDKRIKNYENFIIAGSFLEKGFNFNDIDVLIIKEGELDIEQIKKKLQEMTGVKIHLILIDNKTLSKGLSMDPLYQVMLSKCVAKHRFIYKINRELNYKVLDFHLLKSELLLENFDMLSGDEKYYLTRNMVAISLYLKTNIDKKKIDRYIKKLFDLKDANEIKKNMLKKNDFLKKYREIYNDTFNKIMKGIENGPK